MLDWIALGVVAALSVGASELVRARCTRMLCSPYRRPRRRAVGARSSAAVARYGQQCAAPAATGSSE
jgi:hypothetical protein